MNYSRKLLTAFRHYLDEKCLNYKFDEAIGIFKIRMRTPGKWRHLDLSIHLGPTGYVVLVAMPVKVPPEKRLAVAEFITRVNYGSTTGLLEMNFDTGGIGVRTEMDCSGNIPTPEALDRSFCSPLGMSHFYRDSLLAIIDDNVAAADAIRKIDPPRLDMAVFDADNFEIVVQICEGKQLKVPKVMTRKDFLMNIPAATKIFLIGAGMSPEIRTRVRAWVNREYALTNINEREQLDALSELRGMLLAAETPPGLPLSEKGEALKLALRKGDSGEIIRLIDKDGAVINSHEPLTEPAFAKLPQKTVAMVLERGVTPQVYPQLFLALTAGIETCAPKEYRFRCRVINTIIGILRRQKA